METKIEALKKQEATMLKQFNVEELEERLEMRKWGIKTETVHHPNGDYGTVGVKKTINF